MNHEDEVKLTLAMKMFAKTQRRVRQITCGHPCECRRNLYLTLNAILKLGHDVFNNRPEFHAAIIILADATREMVGELHKTEADEVIYL